VEPLGRALKGRHAWATGLRRDQSPETRENLRYAAVEGEQGAGRAAPLVKINPLLDWSSSRVWDYIRSNGVPYNALHDRGYRSIGCAPCTRASRPGEHERAARWWWEDSTKRECGLHIRK
jgi:phosphoadenosine phosphosulfate reductase